MVPPYDSDEQRALAAALLREARDGAWAWSRADARRCFIAGAARRRGSTRRGSAGGTRRVPSRTRSSPVRSHSAGGVLHYLVAGRRPL